jgi:hypothetical protein
MTPSATKVSGTTTTLIEADDRAPKARFRSAGLPGAVFYKDKAFQHSLYG